MLAVVGTIPEKDFPLEKGEVSLEREDLFLGERKIKINRGTPALVAAAIQAGKGLGQEKIFCFLAGDIGLGDGSRRIYEYLGKHLGRADFSVLVFHYLQPDIDGHNRVLLAIMEMARRPILIADAGFMYAAKMSGQSPEYDLFTPDAGELAFLADEAAPHPFYTRGFVLHEENRVPDLIARAYAHENAARYLLVKGRTDTLGSREGIQATIQEPSVEALEAIGGTGDTLTGIVAALIAAGKKVPEAAVIAARVNRLAGLYANPTPGTSVRAIIRHIPRALEEILREKDRIKK
jgi:NAD(P)H-hydrate repair Nnr-like enzyme with NAD(P)H-hydrate dehydratase domain